MSAWKSYYCNQHLTQEINNNIYNRHRGSKTLEPNLNARAVNTRVTMPIQDCRKPSSVPIVSINHTINMNNLIQAYAHIMVIVRK